MAQTAIVAGLILVAVLAITVAPAGAHTVLRSSTPAAGAKVGSASRIDLRFTEPILADASHLYVQDPVGFIELPKARPIAGDTASLSVVLPPLGDGTYSVTWHVVATDGDPLQGTFSFSIDPSLSSASTTPVTLADPAADFPPDTSSVIPLNRFKVSQQAPAVRHGHGPGALTESLARVVLDLGVAVLLGGFAFLAVVWPAGAGTLRLRQLLTAAAGLAILASFELTAFQNAAVAGLSTIQGLSPWHQVDALHYRFGRIAAVRLVLLVLALRETRRLATADGASRVRSRRWQAMATAAGLALVETIVLLGHAQSSGLVPAVGRLLHVAGISVWLGGLAVLIVVVLPRRHDLELLAVLPRFSTLATAAVSVLTLGGIVLSIELVGGPGGLFTTGYGRLLLLKIAVVAGAVAVAARSRRHVQAMVAPPPGHDLARPPGGSVLVADPPLTTRPVAVVVGPLVRLLAFEVGLVGLVLLLTTLLLTRVPPA